MAAVRTDPFWSGMWEGGPSASWWSREVADAAQAAGMVQVGGRDARWGDVACARGLVMSGRGVQTRLRLLASILMWRTVTAEQLMSIANVSIDPKRWADIAMLWSAGLIERGRIVTPFRSASMPEMFRPLRDSTIEGWVDRLGFDDWLHLTSSHPWTRGPSHDRHNVLATELGLRIAETCDVAMIVGERLSAHTMISPTPFAGQSKFASADATVVRHDGMRIAIEVTASHVAETTRRKISRWVELLRANIDNRGIAVCFVEAGGMRDTEVFRVLRTEIAQAVASEPNRKVKAMLSESLTVARWRWWFPQLDETSDRLANLEVSRVNLHGDWVPSSLLDPYEVDSPTSDQSFIIGEAEHIWGSLVPVS